MKEIQKILGIIGGGNMGEAIITGVLEEGIFKERNILVGEIKEERRRYLGERYGISPLRDNSTVVEKSDIVILAVKPQEIGRVLEEIRWIREEDKLFISIAAGVTIRFIEEKLGEVRLIRCMPNLCIRVKEGITALSPGRRASREDIEQCRKIFLTLGEVVEVEEKFLDTITALSGSGPAYVFYFMESLIQTGKEMGLDEELSRKLIFQTFQGALRLLDIEPDPGKWRKRVTSPGGTTERAIGYFEESKLPDILKEGVRRAKIRAEELSRQLTE